MIKEGRLFALEPISAVAVAAREIIARASANHEIEATECAYQLLEPVTVHLLNINKFNQLTRLIRLLPPTPKDVSVYFRYLNRNDGLHVYSQPVKCHLSSPDARKQR